MPRFGAALPATPELLSFAASLSSMPTSPPHRVLALVALGFPKLLKPGEPWFLNSVARLSRLSSQQQARLHEIASNVELGRK